MNLLTLVTIAFLAAQPLPENQIAAELVVSDVVIDGSGNISLDLEYKNLGGQAQCIDYYDLFDEGSGEKFRVYDSSGQRVSYQGMRASSSFERKLLRPFVIVPAGETVTSSFDLSRDYVLKDNGTFRIELSIVVTKCSAINAGLVEIPSSWIPFLFEEEAPWPERLQSVATQFPDWALVGSFVSLTSFSLRNISPSP